MYLPNDFSHSYCGARNFGNCVRMSSVHFGVWIGSEHVDDEEGGYGD